MHHSLSLTIKFLMGKTYFQVFKTSIYTTWTLPEVDENVFWSWRNFLKNWKTSLIIQKIISDCKVEILKFRRKSLFWRGIILYKSNYQKWEIWTSIRSILTFPTILSQKLFSLIQHLSNQLGLMFLAMRSDIMTI